MTDRALSPVVGSVLLVAVAVLLAGLIAAFVLMDAPIDDGPPPQASFELAVDAETRQIAIDHRGGDAVDVTALDLEVRVDGDPIPHQPPVPYTQTVGYRGMPEGPFNSRADPTWTPGQRAALPPLAADNPPTFEAGAAVEVRLVVDGTVIARLEGTAS